MHSIAPMCWWSWTICQQEYCRKRERKHNKDSDPCSLSSSVTIHKCSKWNGVFSPSQMDVLEFQRTVLIFLKKLMHYQHILSFSIPIVIPMILRWVVHPHKPVLLSLLNPDLPAKDEYWNQYELFDLGIFKFLLIVLVLSTALHLFWLPIKNFYRIYDFLSSSYPYPPKQLEFWSTAQYGHIFLFTESLYI